MKRFLFLRDFDTDCPHHTGTGDFTATADPVVIQKEDVQFRKSPEAFFASLNDDVSGYFGDHAGKEVEDKVSELE